MKKITKYLILQLVILIYALCAIPSKLASNETTLNFKFCFYYALVILILGVYAILWQQVLKKFPLTVAYSCKATTIIWGILIGVLFFDEKIKVFNIVGAIIVIIGIVVMVKGEHAND